MCSNYDKVKRSITLTNICEEVENKKQEICDKYKHCDKCPLNLGSFDCEVVLCADIMNSMLEVMEEMIDMLKK